MPSPGEDIQSWSKVAANNGTADPLIDWHEGQARASVNNSARSMLAAHAKNRDLLNGSIVTTGSANAQQFLSGLTYTTIPTNLVVRLKIGSGLTNTASATLNMDGLGDTLIKTTDGSNLLGGELVGNGYTDLLYNGTNWIFLYSREFFQEMMTGGGGIIIGEQIFDTAGTFTYTPSAGMECCIIECVGGGGGGGGVQAGVVVNNFYVSPGGGSGGYSRTTATAAEVGASQAVVVGAGGAAGAPLANAGDGGVSSVGSLCVANGGKGAFGSAATPGGAGGAVGTGDIVAGGAPGEAGINATTTSAFGYGGAGGSSALGGGASRPLVSATGTFPGTAAVKYGSGGSGAVSVDSTAPGTGGPGSTGVVIITEFSGRGAPGRDGPPGPIGPTGPSGAGTGDVLRQGTPAFGQFAQWTDASHIQGVSAATIGSAVGLVPNCGRLNYAAANQIKFVPYNGDRIKINGTVLAIPAAGLSLANTGVIVDGVPASTLVANTVYLVTAFDAGGGVIGGHFRTAAGITHVASTTAGNVGVEVLPGGDTHSIIGMVRTNASSNFQDDANGRFVLSWFNRRQKTASGYLTATVTGIGGGAYTTYAGWTSSFLVWSGEELEFSVNATLNNAGANHTMMSVGFDSTTGGEIGSVFGGYNGNYAPATVSGSKAGLAEGYHFANGLVASAAGGIIYGGVPTPPVTTPVPGSNMPASIMVTVSG